MKLPLPDHTPLQNPELPFVVWQLKYSATQLDDISKLAPKLQDLFSSSGLNIPHVERVAAVEVSIDPRGRVSQQETNEGWKLSSTDRDWNVVVQPDAIAVETSAFRSYDSIRPWIACAFDSVGKLVAPALVERIGLRFVNLLTHPDEPDLMQPWAHSVRREFAAPLFDSEFADALEAFEQKVVIRYNDSTRANVRSSIVRDQGSWKLLLDIDAHVEPSVLWAQSRAEDVSEELNVVCVQLFQHVLSKELLGKLQRVEEVTR